VLIKLKANYMDLVETCWMTVSAANRQQVYYESPINPLGRQQVYSKLSPTDMCKASFDGGMQYKKSIVSTAIRSKWFRMDRSTTSLQHAGDML
jgi:hypothetical protein